MIIPPSCSPHVPFLASVGYIHLLHLFIHLDEPIVARALARHVTSAIASGTRRWSAGVPALPRGSAAAGPARRGWGSARLDLTAHPGRMLPPQRVQAPWRARSRPGYTHSPPGCSRSPYWHALSGWLPASQQRPAALP